jgi:hypothetical protein
MAIHGDSAHVFGGEGVWCDCSGNGTLTLNLLEDMLMDVEYVISFLVVNGPSPQRATRVVIMVMHVFMYAC